MHVCYHKFISMGYLEGTAKPWRECYKAATADGRGQGRLVSWYYS